MYLKLIVVITLCALVSCRSLSRPEDNPIGSARQATDSPAPVTPSTEETPLKKTPTSPPASPTAETVIPPEIETLAAEFKTLRHIPGHFSGGEWQEAVDAWGGRKHQVMQQLGDALGDGTYQQSTLVTHLGPPDIITRPGDDYFIQLTNPQNEESQPIPPQATLLIYTWRGKHDILYFIADGEKVVGANWWLAGD